MKQYVDRFLQWLGIKDTQFTTKLPIPGKAPDTPIIRAAVHEAGHALVASKCTLVQDITSIHITWAGGGKVEYNIARQEGWQWCELAIGIAGVAAEIIAFEKFASAGSEKDLITNLELTREVIESGLDRPIWMKGSGELSIPFREIFNFPITDKELEILQDSYRVAKNIILRHRKEHWKLTGKIIEEVSLKGENLHEAIGNRGFVKALGIVGAEFIGHY